jgi:hypothetical protein
VKFACVTNEILVESYHSLDEGYMVKDGLIANIIVLLEKYLISKFMRLKNSNKDDINFEAVMTRFSTAFFKLVIKEDFKILELWSIFNEDLVESDPDISRNVFNVDYLNIKPVQGIFLY